MTRIEHLLRGRTGLDAAAVGPGVTERVVRARMRSLGLRNLEDYEALLHRSRGETSELVEAIVVPESWFFRDAKAIAGFARLVVEDWLPAHPESPLRLLSLPCASGEEPYSLVMALLDAGVAADRLQVEGVDISARALARAERGAYGRNSFRGKDLKFRRRHFRALGDQYVLNPAVRRCVRFRQANLLSSHFQPCVRPYDFIFCRNLLIYFAPPTQQRALAKLERLLSPDGMLFVAPVEQPIALAYGFVSAHFQFAHVCRAPAPSPRPQRSARLSRGWPAPPSSPGVPQPLPRVDLGAARRLAAAGRLKEAAELCELHLRQARDSAEAYYLLGVLRDAAGEAGAIDCYRKALYLEPNHYDSLLQMAQLLQKNGDSARARTFQSRAERLKLKMADA